MQLCRSVKQGKVIGMLAGFRRRDYLMDLLLERSEGDVGILRKAFIDVARRDRNRVELPFEEIINRIDIRLAESRESKLVATHS